MSPRNIGIRSGETDYEGSAVFESGSGLFALPHQRQEFCFCFCVNQHTKRARSITSAAPKRNVQVAAGVRWRC